MQRYNRRKWIAGVLILPVCLAVFSIEAYFFWLAYSVPDGPLEYLLLFLMMLVFPLASGSLVLYLVWEARGRPQSVGRHPDIFEAGAALEWPVGAAGRGTRKRGEGENRMERGRKKAIRAAHLVLVWHYAGWQISKRDFKLAVSGHSLGLYSLLLSFPRKCHEDVKYLCGLLDRQHRANRSANRFLMSDELVITHLPADSVLERGSHSGFFIVGGLPYQLPSFVGLDEMNLPAEDAQEQGGLTPRQELIRDCVYCLSRDVRLVEKYYPRLLAHRQLEPWTFPFLLLPCGRQSYTVLEQAYAMRERFHQPLFRQFLGDNFSRVQACYEPMVSHWDAFHRDKSQELRDYLGVRVFRECFGYEKPAKRFI